MSHDEMVDLPGGSFLMGSDRDYMEEAPVRRIEVGRFLIDRFAVTNADFARFVKATGYITQAETAPSAMDYPDAAPDLLSPGSAVFVQPDHGTRLRSELDWWEFRHGADWRHPEGPGSNITHRMDHPVVHVAYPDAVAYAEWCGKSLPTEAEWEFAARGGIDGATFAWGEELMPGGRQMANHWRGLFPFEDLFHSGIVRTMRVGSFPANGYGLFDMIGNVWEWTSDAFRNGVSSANCCGKVTDTSAPRVIKGGSFLCAENHCRRYRPAARHAQDPQTSTCHIGFRCVIRP